MFIGTPCLLARHPRTFLLTPAPAAAKNIACLSPNPSMSFA